MQPNALPAAACSHAVGNIKAKNITAADWNKKVKEFVEAIFDFNIRGQRVQIDHPGWCVEFKFCPDCGAAIDFKALGLSTYVEAHGHRASTTT